MKILLYLIGCTGTFALAFGMLFRVQHWPYGYLLSLCGGLALFVVFVPVRNYLLWKQKDHQGMTASLVLVSGGFASLLIGLSMLFKHLAWMFAPSLLIGGVVLLALVFLPAYFVLLYQRDSTPTDS